MYKMHDMDETHLEPETEWLTVAEVAQRFQVAETTVRRWIYANKLPGTRKSKPLRGDYRIPRQAVEHLEKTLQL